MAKKFIILDADKNSSEELSNILKSKNHPFTMTDSLSSLEEFFETGQYIGVIIDIDSVSINNYTIRTMALKYPGICFLCTSRDRFHPELKDAICYHIYACLNKPVDPDELLYWIKCIYDEEKVPDT